VPDKIDAEEKSGIIIIVSIFTIVCGSFWRVDKIQNGVTTETEVPK
jgi:hypothetical protein